MKKKIVVDPIFRPPGLFRYYYGVVESKAVGAVVDWYNKLLSGCRSAASLAIRFTGSFLKLAVSRAAITTCLLALAIDLSAFESAFALTAATDVEEQSPPIEATKDAEAEVEKVNPAGAYLPLPDDADQPTWLDTSRRYVDTSADSFANWIDNFFGSPRTELESANSTLRLTLDSQFEEHNSSDFNVRLRGKVHLPRVDERLSLVFSDEDDDGLNEAKDQPGLREDNSKIDAGLLYKISERERSRLDFKLGLRSSGKLKSSMRYRYKLPWNDKIVNRFTQTLYFVDGEGFGTRSAIDHDRLIDDRRLFRWSNYARFEEGSNGVEWTSRLSFAKRLNHASAITYFTWVSGDTRPEYLTTSYGIGSRYRHNFYRSWLFYELEPAYAWKREELQDDRTPGWLFSVRLEILFERD